MIELERIMSDNVTAQLSSDRELMNKRYVLSETKAIISHEIADLKNQSS